MGSDSTVEVRITADASGLQSGASQASDSADQISEKLQGIKDAVGAGSEGLQAAGESVGAFGGALQSLGTIAAGVVGGLELASIAGTLKSAFEDATTGTWEWGESLKNLQTSTGITVEQLQVLQYAAEVTGTSMSRLPMIVNQLARAMRSYSEGSKTQVEAARTLGIDPSQWTSAYEGLAARGESR
jgi:methyl-accepting chemotaxis protein